MKGHSKNKKTTIKILVRLNVLFFESFYPKNILILFLNVLSNTLMIQMVQMGQSIQE